MRALAALLFVGCGGEIVALSGDPSIPDASQPIDASIDSGPIDISGSYDWGILVLERKNDKTTAPLSGVSVRVENGGFLEGITDAMGIAHVKVNTGNGPFDITAARTGYTFVSIVGVSNLAVEPIVLTATKNPPLVAHPATGSINGKINSANYVQFSSFWWNTLVTTTANYSGTFATALVGPSPPLSIAAIEIDNSATVVNAVMTPPIMRPQKTTVLDVSLPGSAPGWTSSTISIHFPMVGLLRGSDVTSIGELGDKHLGSGVFITKKSPDMFEAPMIVGVGTASYPGSFSGTSNVTLQMGPGDFTPDECEVKYVAKDWLVRVLFPSVSNGANAKIGPITMLDGSGTTLDDFVFQSDIAGYDQSALILNPQGLPPEAREVWTVYAPAKLAPHHLPHLPTAIKAADTFYSPTIDVHVSAIAYTQGQWTERQRVLVIDKWVKAIGFGSQ